MAAAFHRDHAERTGARRPPRADRALPRVRADDAAAGRETRAVRDLRACRLSRPRARSVASAGPSHGTAARVGADRADRRIHRRSDRRNDLRTGARVERKGARAARDRSALRAACRHRARPADHDDRLHCARNAALSAVGVACARARARRIARARPSPSRARDAAPPRRRDRELRARHARCARRPDARRSSARPEPPSTRPRERRLVVRNGPNAASNSRAVARVREPGTKRAR